MLKSTQKIYPVHNLPPSSNLDFRIEEISFSERYNNTSHFTRIFKQYENSTPSEFRRDALLTS